MPSPNTNAPSLTNGASSTSTEPGGGQATNGNTGSPRVVTNGTSHETNRVRSPVATIEEGKQKAKAVMAASEVSAQAASGSSSSDNPSSPSANGTQTNGTPQTRKRSHDGKLVQQDRQRSPHREIPMRTKEINEELQLERYVNREQAHTAAVCFHDERRIMTMGAMKREIADYQQVNAQRAQHPGTVFGRGWAGYGNGVQDTQGRGTKIILPGQRKRPLDRKSKDLYVTRKDRETQAEQLDELIPIRLDIEFDKFRIRDTFTWNLHDRVVDPILFARHMVEDFGLSLPQCEPLVNQVAQSIQEQILDFHPHVHIDEAPLDPHLPYTAYKNDDMRVVINLNITIGQHTLVDKFEWEINNPLNSPEEFAQQMTRDLSLSGEFTTAIAHCIREQSQLFTKSLYVTGHPFDGRPIEDHELQSSFCSSPLPSSFRPFQAAKDYTPYMYELNEADLEKNELSLSREERRQKRSVNRRGGPALPDLKDRRRTNRTLLVSTVLPGAVEHVEDSRLLKRSAASTKTRRGATRDAGDESDGSESEDSLPGSPALPAHLMSGTARTRGIRGAASAAQAAMRANIGRSATPESMISHHHETRTSARRVIRDDVSSPEPQTLIVKLKLSRQKLQSFLRNQRARTKEMSQTPGPRPSSRNSDGSGPSGSMPPPSSTSQQNAPNQSNGANEKVGQISTPSKPSGSGSAASSPQPPATSKHGATSALGRVEATGPPGPDHPIPPPPMYLIVALQNLQTKYPNDLFEGTMRYTAVSTETDELITLRPEAPHPPNTKYYYYPRIKCKDCPGKLYTPDVTLGVNNFEVHLKNRHHRDKVTKRLEESGRKQSS